MDDSQAITVHTCSGLLVFPCHEFRGHEDFSVALKAVLFIMNSVIPYVKIYRGQKDIRNSWVV